MRIPQKKALSMKQEGKDLIILGVRTIDEYAMEHIKGAINIPDKTISNAKPDLLQDTDRTIQVYCQGGNARRKCCPKTETNEVQACI